MITLYSGTPGSGKSLHATRLAKDRVSFGHPVIANYELQFPKQRQRENFYFWDNSQICPESLVCFANEWWENHKYKESGITLIIDECQLMYNSRTWDSRGLDSGGNRVTASRMEWIRFFSQHRKYGYTIILIAQSSRMIDRQIRTLIEYEYQHRKISNFGWRGWLLSLFCGGTNTIMCVKRYFGLNETIGKELIHARKSIYKLYNTRDTFKPAELTQEKDTQVMPRLLNPGLKAGNVSDCVGRHYARLGV